MTARPWAAFAIASGAVFLITVDATIAVAVFPALHAAKTVFNTRSSRDGMLSLRLRCNYFRSFNNSAHAWDTPGLTTVLPGIIAQPPFSTNSACWYVLAFFSSTMFVAASVLLWNCWTHIGAIAATTALLAVTSAILLAELPSIQPPQLKPKTSVATTPTAAP